MTDEKTERGFEVVDRRVTAEGEESVSSERETDRTPSSEQAPRAEADAMGPRSSGPPVSFPTFLLSLHASALFHLGMLSGSEADPAKVDLEAARQNIDLLEVLKEKTRGNLAQEEEQLLENIMYDLRMLYLQACRGTGKECKE